MPSLTHIAAAALQLSFWARSGLAAPAKDEPRLGGVASESAVCSQIGTSLLQAGGNAADAMIAGALWNSRLNKASLFSRKKKTAAKV